MIPVKQILADLLRVVEIVPAALLNLELIKRDVRDGEEEVVEEHGWLDGNVAEDIARLGGGRTEHPGYLGDHGGYFLWSAECFSQGA